MPRFTVNAVLTLLAFSLMLLATEPLSAQGEGSDEYSYYTYFGPGWGVGIGLSNTGELKEAGDPGWSRDDLDWLWLTNMDDFAAWPIYQVDGGTIGRSSDSPEGIVMTDDEFDAFYEEMLNTLSADSTLQLVESDPNHVTSSGRRWQMFHSIEHQDGGSADDASDDVWLYYYSLFTLDEGVLRLVNFYYEPLGDEDDMLTALDVMLAIDPEFAGDSYDV
jgi:hypothetical protein